ncbi:MAG: apolipoprotein N-acyltransferase [Candidatus Aminicenantes bacterium]|nr:apolipoprotein N-acyltransferase [Candidatus Aminicenantes bacterium]
MAFVFLLPLLLAIENKQAAAIFRIFFYFSFVSYLIVLYWIPRVMVKYGGTTWILGIVGLIALAAFLSVFSGLAGMLIGKLSNVGSTRTAAFWIPTFWIAKDLVIEKIFSGFPWCLAGYSQYKNIYFSQLAEIGGIHMVSFLLICINVFIFRLWKTKSKRILVALATLVLTVYASGFCLLKNHTNQAVKIPFHQAGIIQPNSNHDQVYDFALIKTTLTKLFNSSQQLKKKGAEFVIWPEFTVPIYPRQTPYFRDQFVAFSQSHVPLFAGFTDYQGSEKVFNSMMLFNGQQLEKYDKVHLTPFGEYVPFRRWLFFVKKITDEIGDFSPGEKIHNIRFAGHWFSTPICYEIIYPELLRTMIAKGGEVIITISNDSWLGRSSAPYQHLAMAVFRSIENRRFLLRSTSNGISALVDPAGRIRIQSPLHQPHEFLARFQYLSGRTIFNRWGYFFPYACFLLTLGKFLWMLAKKKGRRYQP